MKPLTAKITKKSNKLDEMVKQLMLIHNKKVEVGHFAEQGVHSKTGLSYIEMMKLHHTGYQISAFQFVPPRPVLDVLGFKIRNLKNITLRKIIKNWSKREFNLFSHKKLLEDLGIAIGKIERGIFGNTSLLESNAPLTIAIKGKDAPLVDTGELKNKVAFKTSIDNTVKEVRK
jgi:hypothetical protein